MTGDERKRFCGECGKHVYNLSAMSEKEAQDFADETQGRECVAYVPTEDGRMHSPGFFERIILRLAGWKPRFAGILAALLPAALAACVSRPTAGAPLPPESKSTVAPHDMNAGVTVGEPAPGPVVPGKPLPPKLVPKPGKVDLTRGRAVVPPKDAAPQ